MYDIIYAKYASQTHYKDRLTHQFSNNIVICTTSLFKITDIVILKLFMSLGAIHASMRGRERLTANG